MVACFPRLADSLDRQRNRYDVKHVAENEQFDIQRLINSFTKPALQ